MSEEKKVVCYKFTLPSKKTIVLREPKIADTRTATAVAGPKAKDNQALLGVLMQEELVKALIVKVNDKELSALEKESLDSLFTVKEYSSVLQCVGMISGDDEESGKPQMEIVTGGA